MSTSSMQYKQLQKLIDNVEKVTGKLGGPDVGEFLASVMSGTDPRPIDSRLYTLIKGIAFREFDGGPHGLPPQPTEDEWNEIVNTVLTTNFYQKIPICIKQSQQAAEKLIDYLHAKMKAVELSGEVTQNHKIEPLDGEDLANFKAMFNNEF